MKIGAVRSGFGGFLEDFSRKDPAVLLSQCSLVVGLKAAAA